MLSSRDRSRGFTNIIFDLDGTLVDSLPGIHRSISCALQACLPLERVVSDIRQQIGPPIPKMFSRLFPGLGQEDIQRLVAAFRQHYDTEGYRETHLYPAAEQTLAALRDSKIAMFVLTNKPILAARAILKRTRILPYFAAVVSAAPDFETKTAAAKSLQQRYRLKSRATALVGDGWDDAAAARECGFAFIFAGYGYGSSAIGDASESIAVLKSLDEILPLCATAYRDDSPRLF